MDSQVKLITGAMCTFAFAVAALVVIPYLNVRSIEAPPELAPYSTAELRGRQAYIAHGCMYCHTQQPRDSGFAPDDTRGWGRAAVPADYVYDRPHLLGSMRTGPDLFNIGVRQPSQDWHLGHLYQPRAYVPDSIMPSYPYLFDIKDEAEADEVVVRMPPDFQPEGKVVVATPEAIDLVKYLLALKRNYPVLPPEPAHED